jgi:prevent-host-death family protein
MKQVGSQAARRDFRDLLDDAQLGESAEISRNGKPVAVLVPAGWYEHTRATLRAFADSDDPPVSADEVRKHVVTLAALLDGMRKIAFRPEGEFRDYWKLLQDEVVTLADLLPENAPRPQEGRQP